MLRRSARRSGGAKLRRLMPFSCPQLEPENVQERANESKSCKPGAYKKKETGEVSLVKRASRFGLFLRSLVNLVYFVPVNDVPPGFEIVSAFVLVFEIVSVLPNIHAEDRLGAFHERVVLVRSAGDFEFAAFDNEPRPAAAKSAGARRFQLFLEGFEAAESGLDIISDF